MIDLLYIDDHESSREILKGMLTEGATPWMHDTRITTLPAPPQDLRNCLKADAILLDRWLEGGLDGIDVARKIHALDWRMPIVILTAGPLHAIPVDVFDFVDDVVLKPGCAEGHQVGDTLGHMRVLARWLARLQAAKNQAS